MIKFGTDGWRAILDQEFNRDNVSQVIQAFCDIEASSSSKLVYVGYDRRRRSDEMAQLTAEILAGNGFQVRLSSQFCPTPCVSWSVKTNQALAGIVITASHNPPEWNGVKFKEAYGGAASPAYTKKIEDQVAANIESARQIQSLPLDQAKSQNLVEIFDPFETYVSHLREFVDIDAIRAKNFKVAIDPLFGAGTNYVKAVLEQDVIQIHDAADTSFGGLNPEPIDKNLAALKDAVVQNKADIGLATDGDADRIGAYDENGRFINSHEIFSLLLLHNVRHRKLQGAIVKSISTTGRIDKICQALGLSCIETPIGFKHISGELLKHNALMGGEESGGISLREHVHERDGVLNGLLLLEMMATSGKSLAELVSGMNEEFGPFCFERDDYHLTDDKIAAVKEKRAERAYPACDGVGVASYDDKDGLKATYEDGSWLLVRASGTEPLLRVYAEAASESRVRALLAFAASYYDISV